LKANRRKLLKLLTSGSGTAIVSTLPTTWTAPIIESVFVPAHAQTTGPYTEFGGVIGTQTASVLNDAIGLAHAADDFVDGCVHFRIIGEKVEVQLQDQYGYNEGHGGNIIDDSFTLNFDGNSIYGKLVYGAGNLIARID